MDITIDMSAFEEEVKAESLDVNYCIVLKNTLSIVLMFTLFCPNIPSSPDLFLIFPPVIVPNIDVFFSEGVPCGVPGLVLMLTAININIKIVTN